MANYTVIEIYIAGTFAGSGKLLGDAENGHEIVDCGAQFCDDNDWAETVCEDIQDAIDAGEDHVNFCGKRVTWTITAPTTTFACSYNGNTVSVIAASEMEARANAHDELNQSNGFLDLSAIEVESLDLDEKISTLTKQEAFQLGVQHGIEMANESNSNQSGCDGWDGMLINADPQFARNQFGWDGINSGEESKALLAEYCRGCQSGADAAVEV